MEAAGGVVLFLAALLALVLANSPWRHAFAHLWEAKPFSTNVSLRFLINEGLMALFFLVAGLEIRRETHDGALSDRRTAMLPLAAALGGIVVPALIYLALNTDAPFHQGWAVPTATDIAFAVGALSVLGKRVDPALRVLLLALAIADDIAAILVIAFFYAHGIEATGMGIAGIGVALALLLGKSSTRAVWPYLACGMILWFGLSDAGLHPALAGVLLGLLMPVSAPLESGFSARALPSVQLETALHPWVVFVVMPAFALANAGVSIGAFDMQSANSVSLAAGTVVGLALGKPLGITLAAGLVARAGLCALPPGVTWGGIAVIGCLGGIGFTMSIFVATLAFPDPQLLAVAKLAVLLGSALAGTGGILLGAVLWRKHPSSPASH